MAIIPDDMRFIGISPTVDLKERKSAQINKQTEPYTMSDIVETVSGEITTDDTLIQTLSGFTGTLLINFNDWRNHNIENSGDLTIQIYPEFGNTLYPIGSQIFFTKKAESLTFSAQPGVTINSVDGLLEMGRINCGATLLKIGANEWNLIGELV